MSNRISHERSHLRHILHSFLNWFHYGNNDKTKIKKFESERLKLFSEVLYDV